ncbi:MAG: hypothetical protein K2I01_00810 [Lachnospiraceae bacterium]|nr:hypothetical protein [Lachnospiraceae bacterium]MDE6129357.1 hypothetical protein [Lachnospiraceae bacterium]
MLEFLFEVLELLLDIIEAAGSKVRSKKKKNIKNKTEEAINEKSDY